MVWYFGKHSGDFILTLTPSGSSGALWILLYFQNCWKKILPADMGKRRECFELRWQSAWNESMKNWRPCLPICLSVRPSFWTFHLWNY